MSGADEDYEFDCSAVTKMADTELKPMAPERLSALRSDILARPHSFPLALVTELLADRDYHAQRADAAERDARVERATRERPDAQFCRTLDALGARSHAGDEALPSEARAIIDEVARLEAMLIARQDAELDAGPPSERDLRLLHATREVARLRARVRVEAEDEMAAMEVPS